MSTITKEFTKEQLIEQAKKNIEVLRGAVEKIPGGSDAAVIHLKLAEITLASLEAAPAGYIDAEYAELLREGAIESGFVHGEPGEGFIPLFTAPPAPVSVPLAIHDEDFEKALSVLNDTLDDCGDSERGLLLALDKAGIEVRSDACRTAMLQSFGNSEQLNSPVIQDCSCRTCRPVTMTDMRFVVCHECGNKRCPHANDHRNACTGSNESGQEGSAYPAAPQQEVK